MKESRVYHPNASIDSYCLRFNMHDIEVLNKDLTANRVIQEYNSETLDIISVEEKKAKALLWESEDQSYKIYYNHFTRGRLRNERVLTNDEGLVEEVEITLHSKILEGRYFEGMTMSNLEHVYNVIMSHKVIYCSFETFTQGRFRDVDMKRDVQLTTEVFKDITIDMKTIAVKSSRMDVGCKRDYKSGSITFNKRESGTTAKPYFKFYSKKGEVEAKATTHTFLSSRFNMDEVKKIHRLEATMKTASQFKKRFDKEPTLLNLMTLTVSQLEDYITEAMDKNTNEYIPEEVTESMKNEDLALNDFEYTIQALIIAELRNGVSDYETIRDRHLDLFAPKGLSSMKSKRSRYKAKIDRVYLEHLKGQKFVSKREAVSDFFNMIKRRVKK